VKILSVETGDPRFEFKLMSTEIKPLNQTLSGVLTFDASTTDMNID